MPFEQTWQQTPGFTPAIKKDLPEALAPITKEMLACLSPEAVAQIVSDVLDAIRDGSIETVDVLVRKRIRMGGFKRKRRIE